MRVTSWPAALKCFYTPSDRAGSPQNKSSSCGDTPPSSRHNLALVELFKSFSLHILSCSQHIILEDKEFICCLIRPQCHKLLTSPVSGPNGALDEGRLIHFRARHLHKDV